MKKLFVYMCVAASILLFGCDLDLEPEGSVTFDHFFQEEADCDALLRQPPAA